MPAAERILDFSLTAAHLSMRNEQLVIRRGDDEPEITTPLSEAAILILAEPRVTLTKSALEGVMRHGGAVLVCDSAFLPCGLMLPLAANFEQTKRIIAQCTAKRPLAKQLWRQVVRAKILSQASTLELHQNGDDFGLRELARSVRSGDPTNVEAQAAQRYWHALFNDPMFRRRVEAPDQNKLLNYGYAVLRAAVGRAICAAGLHPSLGLHHRARGNPWCLADDLMEPYRPIVDDEVAEIVGSLGSDAPLDSTTKPRLIGLMHERLENDGESRTIFEWITRTAASLAQTYLGERDDLFFPEGLWCQNSS